jgi:GntR family transcriptional regulator, transcriptional repressor for pyruvate dehydrogenase complex
MSFREALPRIGRQSISFLIKDLITNHLLSGELKPGDKLPTEVDLSQKLGVGRNSVREALKMLASIGVVEVRKGSGTFIAKRMKPSTLNPLILSLVFEQGTSKELIELRLLLEIGSAELALVNITDSDLERLEQMNLKLMKEGKKKARDPKRLLELDIAFHMELHRIAGNKLLFKLVEPIYTLFFASIKKAVGTDPELAYRNHRMVIEAFRKGDIELIRSKMKESMKTWMDTVQQTRPESSEARPQEF